MTCIAELDDYSEFFFFFYDSFYFVIFPSVWVVPDRVCMKDLKQRNFRLNVSK